MNSTAGSPGTANASLIVDEVGIELGVCGKYRLRCFYEPVFERRGTLLHQVALEGTAVPFAGGQQVPEAQFLDDLHPDDLFEVELMRQVLQVRNYRNTGFDGLQLYLDLAPLLRTDRSRFSDTVVGLTGHMHDVGLDPQLVVCTVRSSIGEDLPGSIKDLRDRGLGIAIAGFGAGSWTENQLDEIQPDIVSIEQNWFAQVCNHDATRRLFGTVVRRLQDRDAKVLVGGIDSRENLGVALDAGADLLQGPLLAGRFPVGAAVDDQPLNVMDLLGKDVVAMPRSL